MRMLGLIGGMSWESTAVYYRLLNTLARERLGGLHSARLVLQSLDFAEIAECQHRGDWAGATVMMIDAATRLSHAGAEAIVICTNTMHLMADEVAAAAKLPVLHIADAAGRAMRAAGCRRPLLLATRFTMERSFYRDRLRNRHGIEADVPDEEGREMVHRVIYEELCQGEVREASKAAYLELIAVARRNLGIDGVILGCTEISLLLSPDDLDLPAFDTTRLHAGAAMDFALAEAGALQAAE